MGRLLTVILALALLAAAPPARAGEKLKIALLPIADTILLHVAQREGYFAEGGLEVELIGFQSALEKDAAVQAGRLDGHFCEISSVIVQRAAGLRFVVAAATSHTSPERRLFGLVTSPARAGTDLAGLRGGTLAVARQTIVDFLADVFWETRGLPEDYLVRRDIRKIPVRVQTVIAGRLDAALLPEPLLSVVERAGGRVLLDDRNLDMPLAVVALAEDRADPRTVAAFRAALTRAVDYVNADPERARRLMAELRLIPPQLAEVFQMPVFDPALIPSRLPSPELYRAYGRWLIKNQVLADPLDEDSALLPVPAYEEVVWGADGPGTE